MAKPHWFLTIGEDNLEHALGCQHSSCESKAVHQWQREATEEEVRAEARTQGPFGEVVRNPQGPHRVAVFACAEHALPLDAMARTHTAMCVAPDEGCACDGDA